MPLIYKSYIISKVEYNYDTYKRELLIIVTFGTKFLYILNTKKVSIIYIDYKPFIGFFNTDYYENIYTYQAEKLRRLYIKLIYIKGEINLAANDLLKVLFDIPDYKFNKIIKKIVPEVLKNKNNLAWFQKSNKNSYKAILKNLTEKTRKKRIEAIIVYKLIYYIQGAGCLFRPGGTERGEKGSVEEGRRQT